MQSLTSIEDLIRWGASRFAEAGLFFGHGTDNALDEAAALVLHALHLPSDLPAGWFSSRVTSVERKRILDLIQRRIELRIPLPYLTGEAWFAGLRFDVNEHVLIPRSPIAELIENRFTPWIDPTRVARILDLCCGSGCIGIAAAAYLPESRVDLVDISADALQVAQNNVVTHRLQERVEICRSDLFEALPAEKYDLILSNPPYVGAQEMATLPEEYRHEPDLALRANDDGLEVVKRLVKQAPNFLAPRGILIVEVGNSAASLLERYPDMPFVWPEFEHGGEGVFLLSAEDLAEYAHRFNHRTVREGVDDQ
ncbi:MAG: 50S ribosomal protein L3 N(5)-glutamine methyltransferase [Candidatus Thiodiazotropha sp. (ex Epidulcina cf. delphinae)]|nr:50S ribosomal protein L3 N(5)-glutamine methyltransferase [Candidatus Thiodiazotropha sp. (ex Epidulcina cf. delphinae)]